jgi:hypothetical protein
MGSCEIRDGERGVQDQAGRVLESETAGGIGNKRDTDPDRDM